MVFSYYICDYLYITEFHLATYKYYFRNYNVIPCLTAYSINFMSIVVVMSLKPVQLNPPVYIYVVTFVDSY